MAVIEKLWVGTPALYFIPKPQGMMSPFFLKLFKKKIDMILDTT